MDMDFQVFPYSLPEKEWYKAIRKHVRDTGEFIVARKNNYVYKIQTDYPKFHCITQEVAKFSGTNIQGTKVLENNNTPSLRKVIRKTRAKILSHHRANERGGRGRRDACSLRLAVCV